VGDPPDVVSLLIALVAIIASKEIAHLVGPYAAIVVLACAGASLSLSGSDENLSGFRAVLYIGVRVLVAVVLTVTLAELLQVAVPWLKPRYTLVPLAFGIGWIRDYAALRDWLGDLIGAIVKRKAGNGKG